MHLHNDNDAPTFSPLSQTSSGKTFSFLFHLSAAVAGQLQAEEARVGHRQVRVGGHLGEGLDLERLMELLGAHGQARSPPCEPAVHEKTRSVVRGGQAKTRPVAREARGKKSRANFSSCMG